jgi:hypothetical protein
VAETLQAEAEGRGVQIADEAESGHGGLLRRLRVES